jgi:alkanesulfonate monooxygenase SsuD/methylene tetrahydromethanopterin reductase-like flavin-dependent oxidoreductase (luciferase family)
MGAVDLGVVLPQIRAEWDDVLQTARHAEEIGLDSLWVVDHLTWMPPQLGILEAWTVLSALAAATQRVELGAQVFCQSFRNPALFAKMAATLDRISGGRFRLLIGAGWFQDEYRAFGYDFPAAGTRVDQLREAVLVLKGLLSGKDEPFTFEGEHYRATEVVNAPAPVRAPLPVEIGGSGDRVLRLIAREADGWNCPALSLDKLDDRLAFLRKECEAAGRSFAELRITCQITCTIGDEEAESRPDVAIFNPANGLRGSVDEAAARLRELTEKGVTGFHCITPRGERGWPILERLVNEVKPKVL